MNQFYVAQVSCSSVSFVNLLVACFIGIEPHVKEIKKNSSQKAFGSLLLKKRTL